MYCTTPSGTRYQTGIPRPRRSRQSDDEIASAGTPAFRGVPLEGDRGALLAARVRELEDPAAFAEASRASVDQAARFSWDCSARALLRLARRVDADRAAATARTDRSSR